jgi:hypothetical protein
MAQVEQHLTRKERKKGKETEKERERERENDNYLNYLICQVWWCWPVILTGRWR